jgi:S1-C subfamily serine protease
MWLTTASRRVGFQAALATAALVGTAIAASGVGFAADVDSAAHHPSIRHPALPYAAVLSAMADRSPSIDFGSPAYGGLGLAPASPVRLPDEQGQGRGVLIASIQPNSPAAKAGLKIHDVVIRYDRHDIYSPDQLMKLLNDDQPDRDVVVTFVRAGNVLETKMTLGRAAATDVAQGPRFLGELQRRFSSTLPQSWRDWLGLALPIETASTEGGGTRR